MQTLTMTETFTAIKSLSGLIVNINALIEDPGIISSRDRTDELLRHVREDIKVFKDITGDIPIGMSIFEDWADGCWGDVFIRRLEHSSSVLSRQLHEYCASFSELMKQSCRPG